MGKLKQNKKIKNKTEERSFIMKETKANFEKINKAIKGAIEGIDKYIAIIGEPDTLISKDIAKDAGIIIPAIERLLKNMDKSVDGLKVGISKEVDIKK